MHCKIGSKEYASETFYDLKIQHSLFYGRKNRLCINPYFLLSAIRTDANSRSLDLLDDPIRSLVNQEWKSDWDMSTSRLWASDGIRGEFGDQAVKCGLILDLVSEIPTPPNAYDARRTIPAVLASMGTQTFVKLSSDHRTDPRFHFSILYDIHKSNAGTSIAESSVVPPSLCTSHFNFACEEFC